MRMFLSFILDNLDIYSLSYARMQKKKRLRCRRFGFCLGLYKSFLRGAGGEAPFASLRSAPPPHAWEAIRNGLKYKSLPIRLPRVGGSWRGRQAASEGAYPPAARMGELSAKLTERGAERSEALGPQGQQGTVPIMTPPQKFLPFHPQSLTGW